MRVVGLAPASDHVVLVVLDIDEAAGTWSLVDTSATRKIELGDHEDAGALRDFKAAVGAFVNSHGVGRMIIRRCTYRGQKRSGAEAIKMEALLQLLDCDSTLAPSQSITRRFEKHAVSMPPGLNKYQSDAFATALFALAPTDNAL